MKANFTKPNQIRKITRDNVCKHLSLNGITGMPGYFLIYNLYNNIKLLKGDTSMKQIIIALLTVIILSYADSKAKTDSCNNSDYMIECSFDKINNMYIIKFEVSERGMVLIDITDETQNEIIILTEGEMEPGLYTVYFKPAETFSGKHYCNMKVYPAGTDELVYANSIKLN